MRAAGAVSKDYRCEVLVPRLVKPKRDYVKKQQRCFISAYPKRLSPAEIVPELPQTFDMHLPQTNVALSVLYGLRVMLSRSVGRDSTSDYFNPRLYWAVSDRRSLCKAVYKPRFDFREPCLSVYCGTVCKCFYLSIFVFYIYVARNRIPIKSSVLSRRHLNLQVSARANFPRSVHQAGR